MAKMVKPVEISIDLENRSVPEPPRKRRTSHGVVCECGSEEVAISNTITRGDRQYPAFMAARTNFKKQKCVCQKCKREWWRRLKVTEEELKN